MNKYLQSFVDRVTVMRKEAYHEADENTNYGSYDVYSCLWESSLTLSANITLCFPLPDTSISFSCLIGQALIGSLTCVNPLLGPTTVSVVATVMVRRGVGITFPWRRSTDKILP